MSFLRNRLKKTLAGGGEELKKRDYPMIKQVLVQNSKSNEYEKAKFEWEYTGLIQEEEVEKFSDQCELCNQRPLRLNFQITNEETHKSLLVGSTCIRRFLILKGTSSSVESWDYFINKSYNFVSKIELSSLLPRVLEDVPETRYVVAFRDQAAEILGCLEEIKLSNPNKIDEFIEGLLDESVLDRQKKIKRIKNILFLHQNIISGLELKELFPYILVKVPEQRYIKAFRAIASEVLGDLQSNLNIAPEAWNKLVIDLIGPKTNNKGWFDKLDRIRTVLFQPHKIKKKKLRLETGQAAGHWATKGSRKARVSTTLSRSEAYKNPGRK
ncbi:MAG: hypothetical protein VR68_08685 [Peptococcaceae bacterium BRH_c4a]|nr:MAG: hypothetical protein VR68_08685 [Peptococcaceae bacterium BRH_c4a]